jgi:cell division protein FtsN
VTVDALQVSGSPLDFETARRDAIAKLAGTISGRPGHVVVTGPDAVTETILSDALAATAVHRSIRVQGRSLDPDAVATSLCADKLGSGQPWVRQREAMRTLVEEARAAGLPIVVAVAGADWADAPQLERLRQMTECVPDATDVVRIVLLGGSRLVTMLRRSETRELATRVVAVVQAPTPPPAARIARRPTFVPSPRALAAGLAGLALLGWLFASRHTPEPDGRLVLAPMITPASHDEATIVAEAPRSAPIPTPKTDAAPLPEPRDAVPPTPKADQPQDVPPPVPAPTTPAATLPPISPPPVAVPEPSTSSNHAPSAAASTRTAPGSEPEHAAPPTAHEVHPALAEAPAAKVAPERSAPPAPPAAKAAPERVAKAAAPPSAAHAGTGHALQVGAFRNADAAEELRRQLAQQFGDVRVSTIERDGVTLHRVRVGIASDADRIATVAALRKAGYAPIDTRD